MINKTPKTLINTGLSGFFFAREYILSTFIIMIIYKSKYLIVIQIYNCFCDNLTIILRFL